jgi:hypothetical protein
MEGLRRDWTPEEAAERAPASDESMAEATPVARRPSERRAGGSEHRAGEEPYQGAEQDPSEPPDPPTGSAPPA